MPSGGATCYATEICFINNRYLREKTIMKYTSVSSRYYNFYIFSIFQYSFGSGALSGKMLLVRIVENNKIDDYSGQVRLSKG